MSQLSLFDVGETKLQLPTYARPTPVHIVGEWSKQELDVFRAFIPKFSVGPSTQPRCCNIVHTGETDVPSMRIHKLCDDLYVFSVPSIGQPATVMSIESTAWCAQAVRNIFVSDRCPFDDFVLPPSAYDDATAEQLINSAGPLSLDIETTDLDPHAGRVASIALYDLASNVSYVTTNSTKAQHVFGQVIARGVPVILCNAKFEQKWAIVKHKMPLVVKADVQVMSAHINEEGHKGLEFLSATVGMAGYDLMMTDFLHPLHPSKGSVLLERRHADAPPHLLARYNALDAFVTAKVYSRLTNLFKNEPASNLTLSLEIMSRAQLALSYMELSGIKLDIETVMKIRSEYIARVSQLETSLRGRAKALGMTQFDIKKPKQKIKLLKLSGINVDSSSKTVLEGRKEPVAVEMMEVSSKLSFLSGILNYASDAMGQGGVLRTNFSCTDLLTGQLTSYDPPVLNIPKDPIRRMVVSRFGSSGSILELDYSQLHLRIMGNVSKCKGFIDAFLSGKDLHARTGAQAVLGIPEEEFLDRLTRNDKVCANARQLGKRINFSVITEITAKGLAELAGIPVRNAETILGRFFEANPEIKKTQENQHAFARRHSYVISPTGRVRHLPYFTSDDKAVRAKAERQATDYLISNPGRFTTLIAMVAMVEALNTANMQSRVINQIHDALVFDVLHSEFDEVVRLARVHCICLPHSLIPEIYNPIKLVMDGKHGRTWYYGKEHERLTLS